MTLNGAEMAFAGFWENVRRIDKADEYEKKIESLIRQMVKEGRITSDEEKLFEELRGDLIAESENKRFIDGVRFGVQFMMFAMQEIETNMYK